MAAMSRPHVTVTLGHFRDLHLVRYGRGTPLVVDREALTGYLESCLSVGPGRVRPGHSRSTAGRGRGDR